MRANASVWSVRVKGVHVLHPVDEMGRSDTIGSFDREHLMIDPKTFAAVEIKERRKTLLVHPPNQQLLKMLSPRLYEQFFLRICTLEQELKAEVVDSHPNVVFSQITLTADEGKELKKRAITGVASRPIEH
jgi:hypothetical protein